MKEKVLLVDDEEEFVETLAERMRTRGMEVTTSNSGARAMFAIEPRTSEPIKRLPLDLIGM